MSISSLPMQMHLRLSNNQEDALVKFGNDDNNKSIENKAHGKKSPRAFRMIRSVIFFPYVKFLSAFSTFISIRLF